MHEDTPRHALARILHGDTGEIGAVQLQALQRLADHLGEGAAAASEIESDSGRWHWQLADYLRDPRPGTTPQ